MNAPANLLGHGNTRMVDMAMAEVLARIPVAHVARIEKANPSTEHGGSQLSFGATLKRSWLASRLATFLTWPNARVSTAVPGPHGDRGVEY